MIYPLKEWETIRRGYRFGEKTFYSARHLGVDHLVPIGTAVFAPCDCKIISAKAGREGGNTVHVSLADPQYGILVMRCMHLHKMSPPGKYRQGEVIGYTGNTGQYSRGPHLHTDISRQAVRIKDFNNFIDPEKYFSERIN